LLRSETRAANAQSFTLWQQATIIEIMPRNLSYYCLLAPPIYIVVLRAHLVHGESHIQCNATGEIATVAYHLIQAVALQIKKFISWNLIYRNLNCVVL